MNPIEQAAAYEPIFYHHPDEKWVPVLPEGYLKAARMWLAKARFAQVRKQPENWGKCRIPQVQGVPSTFEQGEPLIPRGKISIDAADDMPDYPANHAGLYYMGHDDSSGALPEDCIERQFPYTDDSDLGENFLDVSAWRDAKEVTDPADATEYTHPGIEHSINYWSEAPGKDALDGIYVEILAAEEAISPEVVTTLEDRFKADELRVFLYYALFPIHEEEGTEENRADYEGDWVCLAVVAPIARDADEEAPEPILVGYGSRTRAAGSQDRFRLRFSDEFDLNQEGGHPKAFVRNGTHHLHSKPGGDRPEEVEDLEERFNEEIEEIRDELEQQAADADTTKDVLVLIAKVGAGAGIGSIFGPIGAAIGAGIGAIAGAIEAAISDPADIDIGGGGNNGNSPGGGLGGPVEGVPESAFGIVLAPDSIVSSIPEAASADEVRPWKNKLDERVVDRDMQPWWRESERLSSPTRPAYAGRWGVMCTDDNYDRRSGMPFPDFVSALDRSLLMELSRDDEA